MLTGAERKVEGSLYGHREAMGAKPSHAQSLIAAPREDNQYDKKTAEFFDIFNEDTGRPELYYGYMAGFLRQAEPSAAEGACARKRIAVDFGCGTGWLTKRLPSLGFTDVYGIDTSPDMLKMAFSKTPNNLISKGIVRYNNKVPTSILGQCELVSMVHVHYHFQPFENLQNNLFGAVSSMLAPNGHAILVGCPSNHVADTPEHYQNCIHINDVPPAILEAASNPEILGDDDGYIALSCLPRFALKDGTPMKVTFNALDRNGLPCFASLMDTHWSDEALVKAAQGAGLELIGRENLMWRSHPNAYMMMHFKKANKIHSLHA
ncbi:MAG: methyltransferase domain-containing protein [Bdellovibrionales bacterium]|jgi:SAM-dependent methyltransferase